MTMTSRNYTFPNVDPSWANTRKTHIAVAVAIHAISDSKRSPEDIWDNPTLAEWDHVRMAIQEYVTNDFFDAENGYSWGQETMYLN
jgi:hypothetical protein